jgi:hypothetical protein
MSVRYEPQPAYVFLPLPIAVDLSSAPSGFEVWVFLFLTIIKFWLQSQVAQGCAIVVRMFLRLPLSIRIHVPLQTTFTCCLIFLSSSLNVSRLPSCYIFVPDRFVPCAWKALSFARVNVSGIACIHKDVMTCSRHARTAIQCV